MYTTLIICATVLYVLLYLLGKKIFPDEKKRKYFYIILFIVDCITIIGMLVGFSFLITATLMAIAS